MRVTTISLVLSGLLGGLAQAAGLAAAPVRASSVEGGYVAEGVVESVQQRPSPQRSQAG